MKIWKVILATLVIFGAGVVTGGLLVSYADRVSKNHRRISSPEMPSRPPAVNSPVRDSRLPAPIGALQWRGQQRDFVERLDRELKLTTGQRERIEKIVCEGQERTKELCAPIAPQLREETKRVRERIRSELTPQQRERYEELMKPRQPRQTEALPMQERRPRDPRRPMPPRDQPAPDGMPLPPPSNPPSQINP